MITSIYLNGPNTIQIIWWYRENFVSERIDFQYYLLNFQTYPLRGFIFIVGQSKKCVALSNSGSEWVSGSDLTRNAKGKCPNEIKVELDDVCGTSANELKPMCISTSFQTSIWCDSAKYNRQYTRYWVESTTANLLT